MGCNNLLHTSRVIEIIRVMDWAKEQRLRAIEIVGYWQGHMNSRDLVEAFGISQNHANLDIKEYKARYPNNFIYNASKRMYFRSEVFKLHLTEGKVDEYINHVSSMSSQVHIPIERLAPHHSQLKPDVISKVLESIRHKKGLSIQYASMNRPEGKHRIIHPHSLVDTGFRWHIRAYCENRKEFRDFNLGRIIGIPKIVGYSPAVASTHVDEMWNRQIKISLIPNPMLSDTQKHVVEEEFDMRDGLLSVQSRACLIHYLLQRYQIDSEKLEAPERTQLLAVASPNEINPFLFG